MAQYRIPVEETFSWQRPVIALQSNPPGSPVKGQRYIVGSSSTGDWAGHTDDIAWYDGTDWRFDSPLPGWCAYRNDIGRFYAFTITYVWMDLITTVGVGDMYKSTYDTDYDGIVDKAEAVDDGLGNLSTASQIRDTVVKKHEHVNKLILDAIDVAFTTVLKAEYDNAVAQSHTHANKSILDAIEIAFTNTLKTSYDLAVSRMGNYDDELGAIIMEI